MTDTSAAIDVVINGETHSVAAATLPEVLCSLQYDPEQRGIAVAVNAEVIPRSEWAATVIRSAIDSRSSARDRGADHGRS